MVERTFKDCELFGLELCKYAGCEGCGECFVNRNLPKGTDTMQLNDSWRITLGNLPDNVDELHTSTECWFCRDEANRSKASCYVLADMAHPEPAHMKGMFFGFGKKIRSSIGSLVQLPIACCETCMRRMKTVLAVRWISVVVGLLLAIAVLFVPAISSALTAVHYILPIAVFALVIALGFIAGNIISKSMQKNASAKTIFNIKEIPIIKEMVSRGWFAVQEDKGTPLVIFNKQMPRPHLIIKDSEGKYEVK